MRSTIRCLLLVVVALTIQACASSPRVTADYDRGADFGSYRTFAFFEPLGTDVAGYESLVTQALKGSARREMESRGYAYADTGADLLVNFNARLAEKTDIDQMPVAAPLYMGYRRGRYGGWVGYQTTVDQYTEGTLNVDIVDAKKRQLVWEGTAVGRVTRTQRENREAAIDAVVIEIFSKYPFRGG
jgi:hypothetical protein